MKKKIFTLFLALVASVGISSAAITVRLDPSSCSSWSTVRLWAWTDAGDVFDSWPGQIVSKDGDGWYAYTFSSSITSVSIIWTNGTDQTVNIEGVTSSTCYALNSTSGTAITVSVVDCSSGSSQGGTPVNVKIGDLYYNLDATNKTAEVTSQQRSYITTANIPSSVTYAHVTYSVTSIGVKAFYGCTVLTFVTIPNSVTSIGDSAFYNCSRLTSIEIPNSVTYIGYKAFDYCSGLTSVHIFDIAAWCAIFFTDNPLKYAHNLYLNGELVTDLVIPNSVTSIGDHAFWGCSGLTSVTIPNSVTSLGRGAFAGCSSLISVTIPNSITSIEESTFDGCTGLTSVTIGNSVTSIGATAFYRCSSLTSVTIPNSVTSIGKSAFSDCTGLTSVTIGNSVTSIGATAFSRCCSLTSLSVEAGNTVYDSRNNCNAIIETATNTLIFGSKNTTIPNSVTSIGSSAFHSCSGLTSVTIPNSVTSIGDYAFYDSGLTSVTIGNSVTSIGEYAFSYCSVLTSLTIPNSVTSIGKYAFSECTGLKNVILGSSVKVLEAKAFYNCSSIESITCYSQRPPMVNTDALYGLDYSTIVYVPADYLNTYKMHDAWGLYDVRPLGAKGTETTNLNVTPAETTAEVAWPAVSGAATYELVIKDKSGNVICTLVFNANGQLTSIAFAPSRNGAPQQTQAAGFSFTVTGLENGTSYDLTITSKDNSGTTLDTKTISFTTSSDVPQGIDQVLSDQVQCTKVMRNGQIFILRGGKTYTVTGQEVK